MGYRVTISEVAEQDIRGAYLWYDEQQESLGSRFEKHITQGIKTISENPLKFQVKYANIRVHFLKKFPFGIHFQVTEDTILVVAVFHTATDPASWIKREASDSEDAE